MSTDPNELQEARDKVASNPLIQALQEEGPDDVKEALKTIMEAKIVAIEEKAEESDLVKGFTDLKLKEADDLGQAIRLSIGAASTCWDNLEGAGVFQSDRALDIATQLEHEITRRLNVHEGGISARQDNFGNLFAPGESGD